ncbi:hypothetical protein [Cellulosilyticum sp. WCF-2]|uniref:hypothetical protein n=1 Tax=Cellulosilyticum sp. WCF-2 TaxID=2497860 RepID=UPI000F8D1DAE|nr:hypothetical protein [Cellulosilyticum sp. WCF-2]QEH70373.1 hypothetical protein EKH84_19015 [Cellulosilyticum sp. WCF-2]
MQVEQSVKMEQLRPGDILLFSAIETDWESSLIALITNSPVSHTSISYYTNGYIVEENMPHTQVVDIRNSESRKVRTTYIMRMDTTAKSLVKVVDIADRYAQVELAYPMSALPCVAIYLVIKDLTYSLKAQGIITKIVKLAMGALIAFLNQKDGKANFPMHCSQFAYHCYLQASKEAALEATIAAEAAGKSKEEMIEVGKEAAKEFKIVLKDEGKENLLKAVATYIDNHYDQLEKQLVAGANHTLQAEQERIEEKEVLYEMLYHEIKEVKAVSCSSNQNAELTEELVITIYQFCHLLNEVYGERIGAIQEGIIGGENSEKALENEVEIATDKVKVLRTINKIIEMGEYFIAPGDLLSHTENLKCIGVLDYNS